MIGRICLSLLIVFFAGCGSATDSGVLSDLTERPSSFVKDATTWKMRPVDDAATKCLTRFFKTHPELAGSPQMEGKPLHFAAEKDRRFYWLSASADGTTWVCVAFVGGKFVLTEGQGDPFVSAA